jgi:hypothetical protein
MDLQSRTSFYNPARTMLKLQDTNLFFEHALYLVLFASSAGGV